MWSVDLTADRPNHLSPDEQERATRFKVSKPRHQFTNARSTLRALLAKYLDTKPNLIEFSYGEHGKPALEHASSDVQFNVSHSRDFALIAFANRSLIGVDIEWFGRTADIDALTSRFYSPNEQSQLQSVDAEERHPAFLNLWTQKEAYLKAHGTGLSRDTRTFAVALAGGLIADDLDTDAPNQWTIRCLIPAAGYSAAIATTLGEPKLRLFQAPTAWVDSE